MVSIVGTTHKTPRAPRVKATVVMVITIVNYADAVATAIFMDVTVEGARHISVYNIAH
jgi:hypothetical protein